MDDTDAATIDELAAHLREDPVVVQPVMGGGDAAKADAQITAIINDLPFHTYVVLAQDMPGVASGVHSMSDLIVQLRAQVDDGPALWLVQTPQSASLGCEYVDMEPPVDDAYHKCATGSTADLTAVGEVQMILSNIKGTDLDRGQIASEWAEYEPSDPSAWDQTPNAFAPLFVAALVAVMAFTVALRYSYLTFCRFAELPSKKLPEEMPEPEETVPYAKQVKERRARRLAEEAHAARPGTASAMTAKPTASPRLGLAERRVRFEEAYTDAVQVGAEPEPLSLARELAESAEEVEVIAARVIALQAHADAAELPYRACYFHPDHAGPFEWRTIAAGARVRACPACCAAVEGDEPVPDPLELRVGNKFVPYYETDTVWARTGFGSLGDDFWQQVRSVRERGDVS